MTSTPVSARTDPKVDHPVTTTPLAGYDGLDRAARHLLHLLATQPVTRFSYPMLEAMLAPPADLLAPGDPGAHADYVHRVLDQLVDTGLLTQHRTTTTSDPATQTTMDRPIWTIGKVAREFAIHLADRATGRAAVVRVVDQVLTPTLHAADLTATPHRRRRPHPGTGQRRPGLDAPEVFAGIPRAVDWLELHIDTLGAYAHALHEIGEHQRTWHVVDALWPLWLHHPHHRSRLTLDALALRAACTAGDVPGQAEMYRRIGLAHTDSGEFPAAAEALQAGLVLRLKSGDARGQADCRRALGLLHQATGDYLTADQQFSFAANLCLQIEADHEGALIRHHRGALQLDLGKPERAQVLLAGAVEDFAALTDPYHHSRALIDLSRAHLGMGDYGAAAAILADAESCVRELDNHAEQARVLLAQADLADARGEARGPVLRGSALTLLEKAQSPLANAVRQALDGDPAPTPQHNGPHATVSAEKSS